VEARLAAAAGAQIPLNPNTQAAVRVETPQTVKAMQVDFDAAVKMWDQAARFIADEFTKGT
jgi:iron(III) transport system substrate-binding protein